MRRSPIAWFRQQTRKEQMDIIIAILCLSAIASYAIWWVVS